MGTDHGQSCESAEPGWDRIWGIPAWLVGGLLPRAAHAVAAAVAVTTNEPAISLELVVAVVGASAKFTGGVAFVTHVMGGSDCNTGMAGICVTVGYNFIFGYNAPKDTLPG